MCKVLIRNRASNYGQLNCPTKEFDIPSDLVSTLESIFNELNATRKTAIEPIINIVKI